jgi:NADH:ubiquinone oxidoreductase subunit 5 (subunit L)/multisubunit Na+/H+ antiporter MnhA subunit
MANCGLPATSGFVGEFMVILGAVKFNFWIGLLAATALIFGAAYSLWMVKRVIFGDIVHQHVRELLDLNKREFLMLGLLAILTLYMGCTETLHRRDARIGGEPAVPRGTVQAVSGEEINMQSSSSLAPVAPIIFLAIAIAAINWIDLARGKAAPAWRTRCRC